MRDDAAKNLDRLMAGNSRFVRGCSQAADPGSEGSARRLFLVACPDARYSPEQLFDLRPDEVWGYQVAGNVVSDDAVEQVLYALSEGPLDLVVVLGHSRCLTIQHACDPGAPSTPIASEVLESICVALTEEADNATSVHAVRMASLMRDRLAGRVDVDVVAGHVDDSSGRVTLRLVEGDLQR